ncbi:MAG: hypothetical protein GYA55_08450 [SAR324 cluster bacterium]|uniref:Uncharacterized protein n=1 Tax=SAR324 cluster bacterium TaxID=2024889 RepID=A0A7X9FRW2_9DELT|nr:hypothetical protein [SAR324 cluster bacterium]
MRHNLCYGPQICYISTMTELNHEARRGPENIVETPRKTKYTHGLSKVLPSIDETQNSLDLLYSAMVAFKAVVPPLTERERFVPSLIPEEVISTLMKIDLYRRYQSLQNKTPIEILFAANWNELNRYRQYKKQRYVSLSFLKRWSDLSPSNEVAQPIMRYLRGENQSSFDFLMPWGQWLTTISRNALDGSFALLEAQRDGTLNISDQKERIKVLETAHRYFAVLFTAGMALHSAIDLFEKTQKGKELKAKAFEDPLSPEAKSWESLMNAKDRAVFAFRSYEYQDGLLTLGMVPILQDFVIKRFELLSTPEDERRPFKRALYMSRNSKLLQLAKRALGENTLNELSNPVDCETPELKKKLLRSRKQEISKFFSEMSESSQFMTEKEKKLIEVLVSELASENPRFIIIYTESAQCARHLSHRLANNEQLRRAGVAKAQLIGRNIAKDKRKDLIIELKSGDVTYIIATAISNIPAEELNGNVFLITYSQHPEPLKKYPWTAALIKNSAIHSRQIESIGSSDLHRRRRAAKRAGRKPRNPSTNTEAS